MKISKRIVAFTATVGLSIAAMAAADIGPFSGLSLFTQTNIGQVATSTSRIGIRYSSTGTSALYETDEESVIAATQVTLYVEAVGNSETLLAKVMIDGSEFDQFEFKADHFARPINLAKFENGSSFNLRVALFDKDKPNEKLDQPAALELRVDTEGPKLSSVRYLPESTSEKPRVQLRFQGDDLGITSSYKQNYELRDKKTGTALPAGTIESVEQDEQRVTLTLNAELQPKEYEVFIGSNVRDEFQNPSGRINLTDPVIQQIKMFKVYGPQDKSPAVEFPDFAARREPTNELFNAGDRVETRVARLYYSRDAHRVVQIVNRNIKSWNKAGVNRKRIFADEARDRGDDLEKKRDRIEQRAIFTSQDLRKQERQRDLEVSKVARQKREFARVQQIVAEIDRLSKERVTKNVNLQNVTLTDASIDRASLNNVQIQGPKFTDSTTTKGTTTGGTITDGQLIAGLVQTAVLKSAMVSGDEIKGGIITTADIVAGQFTDGKVQSGSSTGGTTTGGVTTPAGITTGGKYEGGTTQNARIIASAITGAQMIKVTITGAKVTEANPNRAQVDQLKRELESLTGQTLADKQFSATDLKTERDKIATAEDKLQAAQTAVDDARTSVNAAILDIQEANRDESIARRNQFEAEVAAATEDPDTYVPGDLDSIDRVMQVSISVIGEGLIQMRGPIRGINEIRKMVNQIDSPLGQVKVGLFTVQINGEQGDKMDEVAARIEGHIDLSRFLTNQSLQLLRRAIQEES